MVSTVRSRPNHYEVLGLTPAASSDGIEQAFAKELLRPRPFGSLAEVTIAYETLRDRIKREAYDISIGVKPKPDESFAGRAAGMGAILDWSVGQAGCATCDKSLAADPAAGGCPPPPRIGRGTCRRTENAAIRGRTATRANQSGQSRSSTETHRGGAATRSHGEARAGNADRRRSPSLR